MLENPVSPEKKIEYKEEELEKLKRVKKELDALLASGKISPEVKAKLSSIDPDKAILEVEKFLGMKAKERASVEKKEGSKTVRIGTENTPLWESSKAKLKWGIEAEQFREAGQTMVGIKFKRADGVEIVPGGDAYKGKVRFGERDRFMPLSVFKALKKELPKYDDMLSALEVGDDKEKVKAKEYFNKLKSEYGESEWILRALSHLNHFAAKEEQSVLEVDPQFMPTEYVVETLTKFTKAVNNQLKVKRGILILEGDAGTGKNKIVEYFAALTHRPLFRFSCSSGKEGQDFTYALEYNPKKGTYKVPSTVMKALKTPGAILIFDEINTLKPGAAKFLNSLFDDDRALENEKAVEGVVLVGLQNPQHYVGVSPLAETIVSRARIMNIDYPPFESVDAKDASKKVYRVDEALILRQYIPQLKDVSESEFKAIWNAMANNQSGHLPEKESLARELFRVINIANKIRLAYKNYHEGKSDNPVNFIFSLREMIDIASDLPTTGFPNYVDVQQKKVPMTRAKVAILNVILPKIPFGEERVYLQRLIDEI